MSEIGLLGKKLGMSREFYKSGQSVPVTVLKMEKGKIIQLIQKDQRGYNAIQLGFGKIKTSKLTKSMKGFFSKRNAEPKRKLKEFRVNNLETFKEGNELGLEIFKDVKFVDVKSKTIVQCSAGHTPGYIIGQKGKIKAKMKRTGMALGIMPDAEYEVEDLSKLEKGDIILLLTDGLAETANEEGELYGGQRVIEELHRNRDLSAAEIVDSVFEAVENFSEGGEQEDDYTMIVAKVL